MVKKKLSRNSRKSLDAWVRRIDQYLDKIGFDEQRTQDIMRAELEYFVQYYEHRENFGAMLAKYPKKGITISDGLLRFLPSTNLFPNLVSSRDLRKFRIIRDTPEENYSGWGGLTGVGEGYKTMYYDAPFSFTLLRDDVLLAALGFEPMERGIRIKQIQGVKGSSKYLRPFQWPRAMVDLAVEWAKICKLQRVEIQSAQNNNYNKVKRDNLSSTSAIYNATAKRAGFKKMEDGNYFLNLRN